MSTVPPESTPPAKLLQDEIIKSFGTIGAPVPTSITAPLFRRGLPSSFGNSFFQFIATDVGFQISGLVVSGKAVTIFRTTATNVHTSVFSVCSIQRLEAEIAPWEGTERQGKVFIGAPGRININICTDVFNYGYQANTPHAARRLFGLYRQLQNLLGGGQ
jgi:hypothetical protein